MDLNQIAHNERSYKGSPGGDVEEVRKRERQTLFVIKIGGHIIDDESKLSAFLKDFAAIGEKKILVHGGGKLVTKLAGQLNINQEIIHGRRITDAETLKLVTMVYAGYINKNIVAGLQSHNCNAIGLCGADGNSIRAHKRNPDSPAGEAGIDYGFVGDVDSVNQQLVASLLENNFALVFAPLTHDKNGQLLNTNADTIAQEIAKALSNIYDVTLVYSFEKEGVLKDAENENSVIKKMDPDTYKELKSTGAIFAGMIPKLDNAFDALKGGVHKVIIGKAERINQLTKGEAGTIITK
jgi:acetylglutamate kinase